MQRAMVLVFADLNYDARVTRQIRWLSQKYEVTAVCFKGRTDLSNVKYEVISITKLTLLRKLFLAIALFVRWHSLANRIQHGYYTKLKHLHSISFDVVIANDVETLPLAFQLSQNQKVIFDAHEYAPRHFEDKLWWRILFAPWYHALCKEYIPKVIGMTTVSSGLADEYEINYSRRPTITTNATKHYNLVPSPVLSPIRIVHHGIINKSRKIEKMIAMMPILGNSYELDLILMIPEYASEATKHYFEALKKSSQDISNVKFLPSLPNDKIVPTINQYDVGLFLLEPVNFNYTYALPNKIFDFVQARLAIAIGPSLEMAKVVKQFDLGVVSKSFEALDLAQEIKKLSNNDIENYKINADKNAQILSEEGNKTIFLNLLS